MQRLAEERFHEIYERHRDDVTLYVRRRAAADSVEDLVAETFLVCWRKLEEVPREPLPWLYAVARKAPANHYRAIAPRELPAGASAPEDAFLRHNVACRVRFHRAKRRLALHLETLEATDAAAHGRPHPKGATS
jgi:RNA polymerase sigma-70 factor (ECF subfamily)